MRLLDIFLVIIQEILKGIVREVSAYFFRKNVLENKETTRRRKQKGGSQKNDVPVTIRNLSKVDGVFYLVESVRMESIFCMYRIVFKNLDFFTY